MQITIAELARLASALTLADSSLERLSETESDPYQRQITESARDEIAQASSLILEITRRGESVRDASGKPEKLTQNARKP